ncbi:unnamed protein product [Durusdinium trenchii]|uniref:Peptidase S59 domain-containing protein n=1 Tax=Durusdinium trenchii TaxID=1381693 RepID=A0ABP0R8F8_9DINO
MGSPIPMEPLRSLSPPRLVVPQLPHAPMVSDIFPQRLDVSPRRIPELHRSMEVLPPGSPVSRHRALHVLGSPPVGGAFMSPVRLAPGHCSVGPMRPPEAHRQVVEIRPRPLQQVLREVPQGPILANPSQLTNPQQLPTYREAQSVQRSQMRPLVPCDTSGRAYHAPVAALPPRMVPVLQFQPAHPAPLAPAPPAAVVPQRASPQAPDPRCLLTPATTHRQPAGGLSVLSPAGGSGDLQVRVQESPRTFSPPRALSPPALPVALPVASSSPSPQASPRAPSRACEDSLAKQLRALQEAKVAAAETVAQSEQALLVRRGQLKRETFKALQCGSLAEALRRWPSPDAAPAMPPETALVPTPAPELASGRVELPEEDQCAEEDFELPNSSSPVELTPPLAPPEVSTEVREEAPVASSRSSRSRERLVQEEATRCCKALGKIASRISNKHLRDLRKPQKSLPPQVLKILGAIALLLGEKEGRSFLKRILADTLPQRLSTLDPASITGAQRGKLRALLSAPDLQPDAVAKLCPSCTALAQWCECIMIFLTRTQALQSEKDVKSVSEKLEYPSENQNGSLSKSSTESRLIVEPDLSRLDQDELKTVHELTVTKPHIGSVVFHGITDCSNLDPHKDIVLKRGYVLVYPDAKNKPPPGEGLNKPATVTMYECFPPGVAIGEHEADHYKEGHTSSRAPWGG